MKKAAIAIKTSDVASGMHMPAPTGFSVSNDIALAKDKKKKKRKKKLLSFLNSVLVKNSTGLTSTPMSAILGEDSGEQMVVHTFKGSMPGTTPASEDNFVSFFGKGGWGEDQLPPQNYSKDSMAKRKSSKRRKLKLKKMILSAK